MKTKTLSLIPAAGTVLAACLFATVSCSSDKKTEVATPAASAKPESTPPARQAAAGGESTRAVALVPGEAGGVLEETITATATVRAVEPAGRKITLEGEDGTKATFTAPPEMRNFDQVSVGDRVKATIASRLVVFVSRDETPGEAYAAVVARTPKGAKPGAMVAESFEVVATVKSIDTAQRRATLEFADGETRTVPIRDDVDLTKYQAGDRVVIRITQQLAVVSETP